jgi:hypothetical protein
VLVKADLPGFPAFMPESGFHAYTPAVRDIVAADCGGVTA